MNGELKEKKYEGMESLTTAIIVCDRDLIIHYINPSTESIFEVSAKQAINNNISIFFEDIPFSRRVPEPQISRSPLTPRN